MRQEHIYSRYDSFKLPFAEAAIVNLTKILSWTCYRGRVGIYIRFFTIIKNEFTSQKIKSMPETPKCVFLFDTVDELAIMGGTKKTLVDIREKYKIFHLPCLCKILLFFCSIPAHLKLTLSFLRNVQNKRDITLESGSA